MLDIQIQWVYLRLYELKRRYRNFRYRLRMKLDAEYYVHLIRDMELPRTLYTDTSEPDAETMRIFEKIQPGLNRLLIRPSETFSLYRVVCHSGIQDTEEAVTRIRHILLQAARHTPLTVTEQETDIPDLCLRNTTQDTYQIIVQTDERTFTLRICTDEE